MRATSTYVPTPPTLAAQAEPAAGTHAARCWVSHTPYKISLGPPGPELLLLLLLSCLQSCGARLMRKACAGQYQPHAWMRLATHLRFARAIAGKAGGSPCSFAQWTLLRFSLQGTERLFIAATLCTAVKPGSMSRLPLSQQKMRYRLLSQLHCQPEHPVEL